MNNVVETQLNSISIAVCFTFAAIIFFLRGSREFYNSLKLLTYYKMILSFETQFLKLFLVTPFLPAYYTFLVTDPVVFRGD